MSCLAPSFTKLVTQVDPFEKLQQVISRALKGTSKEQQVLNFLGGLRDVSRSFNSMSDEEKKKHASEFLQSAKTLVDDIKSELMKKAIIHKIQDPREWFLVAVIVLVILFAFFGYKLYKSLTEKDRKREEKLKAKQAKKKK